jgi:hypothetical protein
MPEHFDVLAARRFRKFTTLIQELALSCPPDSAETEIDRAFKANEISFEQAGALADIVPRYRTAVAAAELDLRLSLHFAGSTALKEITCPIS